MILEHRPNSGSPSDPLPPEAVSASALPAESYDHLNRLLAAESEPFYKTFIQNIKDLINPPKLPPLELTSKPVPVKDIWGRDENKGVSAVASLLVHIGLIAILVFIMGRKVIEQLAPKHDVLYLDPGVFKPQLPPKAQTSRGGGGGGANAPTPPAKGQLPKISPKPFVPPKQVIEQPVKLPMEASINIPPDLKLPKVDVNQFGNPLDAMRAPSDGSGSGGGIGSGKGGGIGPGDGNGLGPGKGGGFGGGVFRPGGGVSAPALLSKTDPEYSEEARKAKFQGTVTLAIVVDEQGHPIDIRVVRTLGLGLDEKAIEAVRQWRFRPGMRNGQPVKVAANVEVNFRLL